MTEESIPFAVFGNDEIEHAPRIGKKITCERCGKRHRVGELTLGGLHFYRCKGETYLCGIDGKDVRR